MGKMLVTKMDYIMELNMVRMKVIFLVLFQDLVAAL